MTKILVATHNPAKLNSYKSMLTDENIEFLCLADLGIKESAPENLPTFKENAIAKAKYYFNLANMPTLAEDSGVEIDALNGWPGVNSRRIYGSDKPEATDGEIIKETISRLKDVPFNKRTCHMKVVMALVVDKDHVTVSEAQSDCYIALEPSQHVTKGFPFRSLFYLPEYQAIDADLRDLHPDTDFMPHRKNAIMKLTPLIKHLIE